MSRDCRRIVASDWYQKLFPTRLSAQRQAVPEFETTAQGCRIATSVGGVLTAHGLEIRAQRFCGFHDPAEDQSGLDSGLLLDSSSTKSYNLNLASWGALMSGSNPVTVEPIKPQWIESNVWYPG